MNKIWSSAILCSLFLSSCSSQSSSICSTCKCDNQTIRVPVLIDCQKSGISSLFKDWKFPDTLEKRMDIMYDIDLADNNLEAISTIPKLAVQMISFKMNKIREIKPGVFANLTFLSYLDLSFNSIDEDTLKVEDIFRPDDGQKSLPLINLNLAYNNIKSIPNTAFKYLDNLDQINLEGNPLLVLDHSTVTALTSLANLNNLNLARTKLSEIPEGFLAGLPHLIKLDLSYNGFVVVPEETEKAAKLIEFNIDGNPMKDFSRNSFIGMSCLQILSASNLNLLEKIEAGAFSPLPNLTTLIMNNNPLNAFLDPDAFDEIVAENFKVRNLHLRNNSLRYLPHDLWPDFSLWNKIDVIDLRWNPWVCDCHNEWMMTSLYKHIQNETPDLANNLVCGNPEALKGLSFDQVPFETLPCNPKDNFNPYKANYGLATNDHEESHSTLNSVAVGVAVVCLITITLSALVFTIVYVRRHSNRYSSMHNVHYRVTPQGPGMTFENSIYRDNPTTIPTTSWKE